MIILRKAIPSDYRSIAALHATNWQTTYRGMMSDHYLDHEVVDERLLFWKKRLELPDPQQETIVALSGDELMGFVCMMIDDDPEFGSLIDNLHVMATQRKTGIGKMLLKECAGVLLTRSSSLRLYLWVYELNQNARMAYEKLGGLNVETVDKLNDDGSRARICRYYWEDARRLL